jgi:hypothetical protein
LLNTKQVFDLAGDLLKIRFAEMERLNNIYAYLRGLQGLPAVPQGVPDEVRKLAKMSRVNMIRLVIDVPAQSLYVSGYRSPGAEQDSPGWDTWQANQLDARQTGVHRAALAYGASYVSVLPGEPKPVVRGLSPRKATCFYGADDVWPRYALELRPRLGDKNVYRLFDDEAAYTFIEDTGGPRVIGTPEAHDLGVTPFVRFRNLLDLDDDQVGEVEPLMPLQDQVDFTTFALLVAQQFQSFRQRYVIGWTTDDESTKAKAGASRMWTFDDPEVKVGEFGEVNLAGYLDSREATLQHLATISQTPPHHLLGKLVNLSAEALVAAESGHRRKIAEREITFGEAWEQALGLAARAEGLQDEESAQVRWQDTEARSFAATVDGLGKLAEMLHIPVEALWEKVPGVTQTDVESWKKMAREGNALASLTELLDRQAQPAPPRSVPAPAA